MTRKIYYTETPDNNPDTLRKYANDFKKYLLDNFNVSVRNDWLSDSASDEAINKGLPEEYDLGFYLVAYNGSYIYYGWKSPTCIANIFGDEYVEILLNSNYIGTLK